jgi:hypothetical protein
MKIDQDLIQQCDLDIRTGHSQRVAHRLSDLNALRVPRNMRLPLAKICRRAGLYTKGLLILGSLISENEISPAELAEYSVLLMRIGTSGEALEKLKSIDVQQAPEALLYRAYGHFLNWEFQAAVPLLKAYLEHPLEPYARLVGQTNLAFALVEARDHHSVLQLTEKIIHSAEIEGNKQLQGSCRALRVQCWIQDRQLTNARAELDRSRAFLNEPANYDQFSLRKWGLIYEGLESRTVQPFRRLKELAAGFHDWESCREADLYSLLVEFSGELYVHLHFGSPIEGFRERMMAELGSVPNREFYVLGDKSSRRLDLRTARLDGNDCGLNPGKKNHLLLQVLLADFYRPQRIGGLFSNLFQGEHFDVSSSPGRVHQILRRTRQWASSCTIPLIIDETDGFYSLQINGNLSFLIARNQVRIDTLESQFQRLCTSPNGAMTLKDVCQRLQVAETSANRLLKWATAQGLMRKSGKSKQEILYQVVSHKRAG